LKGEQHLKSIIIALNRRPALKFLNKFRPVQAHDYPSISSGYLPTYGE
jgi:hypothetical protein